MPCQDIGPRDARIMLVGEAPGAEEERTGKPFQGASGHLLKSLLRHAAGIDFNQCFVTNVMSTRPPGDKFEYFYDTTGVPTRELEAGWAVLRDKIEAQKPDVCILLGAEPLRAVTNLKGIMNWRGCFLSYKGIKLMPTVHPAAILRDYSLHPIFELDIQKATTRNPAPWPETIVAPSLQQVLTCCQEAERSSLVAYDIETISKSVRSLALAYRHNGKTKAISIPLIRMASSNQVSVTGSVVSFNSNSSSLSSYWTPQDEVLVLRALALLFESGVPICGQNSISFDEPLVEDELGFRAKNHYIDLMHLWHLVYCEFPKGLDFICSIITDYPNYWTQKDSHVDLEEWEYNARDAIVTLEACERLEPEAKDVGVWDFYRSHVHPLVFDLVKLQNNGILIDEAARTRHKLEAEKRSQEALANIEKLIGRAVNPGSSKQMKTLLYDQLKFPVQYSKTRAVTTDEEALRKLAKAFPNEPVLQHIIAYRKAEKLLGTYLTTKTSSDGRMRSSYNASGTETGRLSSSQNIWGEGTNLQNIPAGKGLDIVNIKDCYVAPAGKYLLKGDLKQAETMVVAEILHRLGFSQLHDKYQNPAFDIHKWAAAFGLNKDESTITKRERDVFKIVNHSGNYMSGPNVMVRTGLKYGIDLDFQTAKALRAKKLQQMPELQEWWNWVGNKLKRDRELRNCFGRLRIFFGRLDESTQREAVAWEPQSTVGDLTNRILRRFFQPGVLPPDCFPVLQVHDEIVLEVTEAGLEDCIKAYKAASAIPLFISKHEPLIIPVELSFGRNWKDMKEVKQ